MCKVEEIPTCRFNETDALLDEDWDRPLRGDHGAQRHAEVVAFNGFGDGMPWFRSWFLGEKINERKTGRIGGSTARKNINTIGAD